MNCTLGLWQKILADNIHFFQTILKEIVIGNIHGKEYELFAELHNILSFLISISIVNSYYFNGAYLPYLAYNPCKILYFDLG